MDRHFEYAGMHIEWIDFDSNSVNSCTPQSGAPLQLYQ